MKRYPSIWSLDRLRTALAENNCQVGGGGQWHPARQLGWPSLGQRIKASWLVFTGRADALIWPGGQ